jgi:CheY-like chemotaxis protein
MEVASGHKSARVLLADDSFASRTCLRAILSGLAVSVEEATDGGEALGILLDRDFDLLITDLNMAPISGAQLVMAVRLLPQYRRPKIIIHSAEHGPSASGLRQIMTPDERFLAKPASAGDLIAAVASLLPCTVVSRT